MVCLQQTITSSCVAGLKFHYKNVALAISQDSLQNKVKENGSVIIKAENFADGLAIMTMWLIGKMMVNI